MAHLIIILFILFEFINNSIIIIIIIFRFVCFLEEKHVEDRQRRKVEIFEGEYSRA